MSKLDTVCAKIDQIATISGSNAKQNMLQKHLEDTTFRWAIYYALNPYMRFGKRVPTDREGEGQENREALNAAFFKILDDLAQGNLSGNDATETIDDLYARIDPLVGKLFSRILNKDLRAGFTAKTVNKARPGTVPEFNVMLAKSYEPKRIKQWPVQVEPKYDGVRVLTYVDGQNVEFFSRTGKQEFADMPRVRHTLANMNLNSCWLDGEVITSDFNDTVSQIRRKDRACNDATLIVFDLLHPNEFRAGSEAPLYERHHRLSIFPETKDYVLQTPSWLAHSHEGIQTLTEDLWDGGYEGVVVKPYDGTWQPKRSANWLKIKAEQSVDVCVTRLVEGQGKYAGQLGAAVVDLGDGQECYVGGGFSDAQRDYFWRFPDQLCGHLIEVEYHEMTPDGNLRHPRFKCFRPDKEA